MRVKLLRDEEDGVTVRLVYPATLDEYGETFEILGGRAAGRGGSVAGHGSYVVTTEEQRARWRLPDLLACGRARVVDEAEAFGLLCEVRTARLALIDKTEAAVKDRLTKEISYWDHRAAQLALEEGAGKTGARLNSGEARRRADTLQRRLQKRLQELKRDAQISPRPPVVLGGLLVVPRGLVDKMTGRPARRLVRPDDTQLAAARARAIVMETECSLGFEPTDREFDKLGYDIESRDPATGKLRFIEVKGRRSDADTVTVTKNEILYSLNTPDDFTARARPPSAVP